MNWVWMRQFPWLDTRARFVSAVRRGGTLLDLGTADGETLSHFAELRPDLKLAGSDLAARPASLAASIGFHQLNFLNDRFPLPDASVDGVTCLHVVEHLPDLAPLLAEVKRLLAPGGRAYFETPHPRTVALPSAEGAAAGTFPMNFWDDMTHVRVVSAGYLANCVRLAGLGVEDSGTSRNWLFAAAYPALRFAPVSRKKLTARLHWIGWSSYVIARRR